MCDRSWWLVVWWLRALCHGAGRAWWARARLLNLLVNTLYETKCLMLGSDCMIFKVVGSLFLLHYMTVLGIMKFAYCMTGWRLGIHITQYALLLAVGCHWWWHFQAKHISHCKTLSHRQVWIFSPLFFFFFRWWMIKTLTAKQNPSKKSSDRV